MNTQQLQEQLCASLCAQASAREISAGQWRVDTPFSFPDGDAYALYVEQLPVGGLRLSDKGATLMHLSYENDIEKFRDGIRNRLLQQILSESDVQETDGEFFLEIPASDLGHGVFRFGQALTRVHDLTFLNRLRIESTFYEDLRETLRDLVGADALRENYVAADVPRAQDYPVDYKIEGGTQPLYLFGVPSRDKARLATVVLQHLIGAGHQFNSIVVFQNMAELSRIDVSRLTNAANDQIDSLDARADLSRKISQRRQIA